MRIEGYRKLSWDRIVSCVCKGVVGLCILRGGCCSTSGCIIRYAAWPVLPWCNGSPGVDVALVYVDRNIIGWIRSGCIVVICVLRLPLTCVYIWIWHPLGNDLGTILGSNCMRCMAGTHVKDLKHVLWCTCNLLWLHSIGQLRVALFAFVVIGCIRWDMCLRCMWIAVLCKLVIWHFDTLDPSRHGVGCGMLPLP